MAKRARPAPPLTSKGLLARIALYVVSISLWLLLALFSNNGVARICGGIACALNVMILGGYIRRYRALRRAGRGQK
jgi:hypothetical protein